MPATKSQKIAVLIDADNVQSKVLDHVFETIGQVGKAAVRRAYGDFSGTRLKAWADASAAYAIKQQHVTATPLGKNATDIALVIDAMNLLHTSDVDCFCIVSSDSDFGLLASHLGEQGADVIGFGSQHTPVRFRNACTRFEAFAAATPVVEEPTVVPHPSSSPSDDFMTLLGKAIEGMRADKDGWVALGGVGSRLQSLRPGFRPRAFGCSTLTKLVEGAGCVEFTRKSGGSPYVRLRTAPSAMSLN